MEAMGILKEIMKEIKILKVRNAILGDREQISRQDYAETNNSLSYIERLINEIIKNKNGKSI